MYKSYFETKGSVDADGDPDIVYYNANIVNDNALNSVKLGNDPVVKFQETRLTPIIKDMSKYNFSIIRFTVNGANKDIPLFIPDIQVGQSDINLTTYSVGLQITKEILIGGNPFTFTGYAQRFVEYVSESLNAYTNNNVPLPSSPVQNQDVSGVYYYVYTYDWWVDLCNSALQHALDDTQPATPGTYHPTLSLQAQFDAFWVANGGVGPAPAIITEAPYIKYDPSSGLFSIYFDTYGFGGVSALSYGTGPAGDEEALQLWFNSNMFGLFTNFKNEYNGNDTNGQVNNILVNNKFGTNIYQKQLPTPGASPTYLTTKTYYVMTQDYPSTSTLWSPVDAIVFTSALIPVISEQASPLLKYGEGNDVFQSSSSSNFTPIITDIALPMNTGHDYRQFIEYVPSGEYRISSFQNSKNELRSIDIQVFWRSRLTGELIPLRLFNLSSISIKIMFRKK